MEDIEIRKNFSSNITKLRKSINLNQAQLAEKLNYTDKAISKWETGETMPDVVSMHKIASFFNVTIDDLISNTNVVKKSHKLRNHILITLASTGLCFLLATIAFFFLKLFDTSYYYLPFVLASISASIVLVVFSKLWFKGIYVFLSITLLIIAIAMLIMCLMKFKYFYLIIIIALIIDVLMFMLLKVKK